MRVPPGVVAELMVRAAGADQMKGLPDTRRSNTVLG